MPRCRPLALTATATALLLGACGTPVSLEPAPSAAAPDCGDVLQATPDVLADGERRSTDSQASTAWGEPAITLRCGVEPPPPTTAECLSIELPDGRVHDWIHTDAGAVLEDGAPEGVESSWVSYGRRPAIEVVVPAELSDQASAVLVDLDGAVEATEHVASCVGAAEVESAEAGSAGARSGETGTGDTATDDAGIDETGTDDGR
ncbi:DUF3515 family protein [Georgenia sp. Z1491]|uniref:DUF3515 family protein n=1 Tax=Georgenia sp. Z1491 TaxID=3416707 RepID=UPI003CF827B9